MRLLRLLAVLVVAAGCATSASAHGGRAPSGDSSGLSFPSVTHGEMAILAGYRSEIWSLAQSVANTDPTFRRLMNYSSIEFSYYCGWGLAPGSLRDEASPFNECAHAYLSADKAMLLHMRDMKGMEQAASELISRIDVDMVKRGAAFIGCQYSGETFNTAEFVTPRWENLSSHTPTLAAIGGLAAALAALIILSGRMLIWPARRQPRT